MVAHIERNNSCPAQMTAVNSRMPPALVSAGHHAFGVVLSKNQLILRQD
jgi:hypothetical protein